MADQTPAEKELDWKAIGAQLAHGFLTEGAPGLLKAYQASELETKGATFALGFSLAEEVAVRAGELLHTVEAPLLPIIAAFVAPILSGLFGAEFNPAEFSRRLSHGDGTRGAEAIVEGFMRSIVGDTPAEIVPGNEGATRIATAAVQANLESIFNALIPEIVSDFLPAGFGHLSELSKLPEDIIGALGVSRLVRRALGPIVQTCCTTPATWHMNRLHRPTLLGAATLAKQIARHPEKRETWLEDLRREGYSDERIEALLNEQAKFHSVSDVFRLVRADVWTPDAALRHLQDQGYDADVAAGELQLEKLKAIESFDRSMASSAVDAFAGGRIDEAELGGFCSGTTISAQEKAQYVELAHARRICNRRPLTPSEAAAAVEAGVLAFVDYRRALERDGRDETAVLVLELMLRAKLDDKKDAAQHRADIERERAADKAARDKAAADKKAAHEAQLTAAARGRAADLEQAAIRGLIPIARVAEVWARDFDDETVGILVALLEDKRAAYVAQQAARDALAARSKARGVDVGQLEAAVAEGVLTLDEFRGRLGSLVFAPADADLLTATLAAKLRARDEAKALHDQAVAAGKTKHVDVATLEVLVRRGHRSMADFDAALVSLGFDDAARAALRERVQLQIDDDAAARAAHDAATAKLAAKGLSWDQHRRAVLLGVETVDDAGAFLFANGFTADAQATLLATLRADVAEADAARRRRDAAETRVDARDAPLSDVARAVRLGIVPIQTYLDRLARDGWTDDAIALETDLLLTELADAQAARAKRDALADAAQDHGLALAQAARAVRAHKLPIENYTATARAAGYSADAADVLTALLRDELAAADAAAARRAQIAAELDAARVAGAGAGPAETPAVARVFEGKRPSLAQLERAVLAGELELGDYRDAVRSYGYADDDADLLTGLVRRRLEIQTAAAERKGSTAAVDAQRELQRATLQAAVVNGLRTTDDYAAWLVDAQYAPADVDLFLDDAQQQIDLQGAT